MIVDLESLFIFLECSLLFIYACIYIHFRNARDKWKQLGVHTLTSTDKFGNFVNTFLSKLETRKRVTLLYQSFRGHAVGGLYTLGSPTLLVLDPASVRYALRLERWPTAHGVRLTRRLEFNISNLSSTVFETLLNCSSELSQCLMDNGGTLEIHDVLERFTIDVTSGCAYGVPLSTLRCPTTELRQIYRCQSNSSFLPVMDSLFREVVVASARRILYNEVSKTCLLKIFEDDEETLMEQAAVFLTGGQLVADTLALCLYELAHNPHIQDHSRAEVDRILEQHGNSITQKSVRNLKYLHVVILETLRKYAPVSEIRRCCSTQTVLPGCNVTIEGGTQVQIPVLGLHNDPRFFPEPERFDPDRLRHIRTTNFLGFGAGSGSCTGSEFALLQMKVGLLYILRNHFIYTSHKTPKYNTDLFPLNEIWLTIARREKKEHN